MIKQIFLSLFMIVSISLSGQCYDRYQNEIFNNVSVNTVNYSDVYNDNFHKMDIYTSDDDTATNRPVIIFHHGGSYYGGTKQNPGAVDFCTAFARKGYVAISSNYRIVALQNIITFLTSNSVQFETVLKATADMKAAIRYVKKNYSTGNSLGVDSSSVFIGGISSGGITAIHTAYIDNISDLPTSPIDVQAIVTSLGGLEGDAGNNGYSSSVKGIINFAGGINDINWIDSNDEPIFTAQGVDDVIVNYNCGPGLDNPAVLNLCGLNQMHPLCDSLGVINQSLSFNNTDHYWVTSGNNPEFIQAVNQTTDFLYPLLSCNQTTNTQDIIAEKAKVIHITNLLGKTIRKSFNTPMLYIYDNGKVEKKVIFK
jgi:dienelactone hydrolase